MSRPVYYFDTQNVEYTLTKDGGDGCVFEFNVSPKEAALLRKPKCFLSTTSGLLRFAINGVQRMPGDPVGGKHPYRIETTRMY